MKKITLIFLISFLVIVAGLFLFNNENDVKEKIVDNQLKLKKQTVNNKVGEIFNEMSMDEISKHNKETDCYLLINGGVYDVTEYMYMHPGGVKKIVDSCGKDVTESFATKGHKHSKKAWSELNQYKIGKLKI